MPRFLGDRRECDLGCSMGGQGGVQRLRGPPEKEPHLALYPIGRFSVTPLHTLSSPWNQHLAPPTPYPPATLPPRGPSMRSDKQKAASRANGRKSRGPVTPEGKRRARPNALKHGHLAECVLLPFESPRRLPGKPRLLPPRVQPPNRPPDRLRSRDGRRRLAPLPYLVRRKRHVPRRPRPILPPRYRGRPPGRPSHPSPPNPNTPSSTATKPASPAPTIAPTSASSAASGPKRQTNLSPT